MIKFKRNVGVLLLSVSALGCSTDIGDYESVQQPFDIKTYFNQSVTGWGMVQDYTNKVNRRFCVEIVGTWQENQGTLAEVFYFNDGEVSYRNWQLTKLEDGSYSGTAGDVDGVAKGVHQGFAFQFNYDLLLTLDETTYKVAMDDWMYQLDEYRVMNKTSMHKFGVKVADVTLFFDKEQQNKRCKRSVI
ncbi:DUF3833 domain-containing protein [Psychrobium sp. 1_MG-2023]|uniref:DUF3833 domain-containing protein n=1 Tax=Psychrobium sp. 1_MG-2023 TaxID=3062624 RepID=UPI000C348558|nr:DUF3833 domain-containing protein [Psychrobium sp. 1_MG-2023]MDP2562161.1 DUF3833 domain-containing protein [Psychrobium sp. 1_MG-2023]PKF57167.1 DUF3833 domain-containing protein [Alteromonadales bacterium alter-6D02]